MSSNVDQNVRPDFDELIQKISDYSQSDTEFNNLAMETARYCLMDTLGCGLLALTFDDCKKMLGPFADDVKVKNGVRVPGTSFILDPVKGAWTRRLSERQALELDFSVALVEAPDQQAGF